MAIITREKAPLDGWYAMEDKMSWFPSTKTVGLFIPIDSDTNNTTMVASEHSAAATVSANAASTVVGGIHTVITSTTNISLSPDPAFTSATRNIVYAWGFTKGDKYLRLSDGASSFFAIDLNEGSSIATNKGMQLREYSTHIFTTLGNNDNNGVNHGVDRSGDMEGVMVKLDFDYANDLLTATHRTGGLEATFTDTYVLGAPGAQVLNTLAMELGLQVYGAGVMQFTAAEDAALMADWRSVWDRMETEWLAGNRVMPKEFLV